MCAQIHTCANTHAYTLSGVSHRQADRHQFTFRHKSQPPQGTGSGPPILLSSVALFSLDNGKHHQHLHLGLLKGILYAPSSHPLIGVLFALPIPGATCLPSCLYFTAFLPLSYSASISPHLAVSLQHVTVCVSCLSPEVYLSYLWGWVTMANPVFRWLFSTLRGGLAEPEVSSCYRTP